MRTPCQPVAHSVLQAKKLLALNTLDVRLHNEVLRMWTGAVKAYGGERALNDDATLYLRFSHAFKAICLGCCPRFGG